MRKEKITCNIGKMNLEDCHKVLYICDRRKCENCYPECSLTNDIRHAVNFEFCGGLFAEKQKNNGI